MASDLATKIVKQVEYYFSDINFNRDKFLKDQSGKEDGWIPISTLLTFNRLKALTEKNCDVADAFEKANSEIVELNETKDKLRRLKELPEINDEYKQNFKLRTVHLKGFPKEDTTLDDLIEYCSQYGPVESVQMRRYADKKFKGCCFAIYKNVESANKAVSSNDKFKNEFELSLRENKETYFKRKSAHRNKKNRLINSNTGENCEDGDKNDESNDKKEVEENEDEVTYESGLVIKLINLPDKIHFKDIKPKLCEIGNVQFVDIFPETNSAIVRFASLGDRDIILQKMEYLQNNAKKDQMKIGENLENTKKINNENGQVKNDLKSTNENETENTENKGCEKNITIAENSIEQGTVNSEDDDRENQYKFLKISDDLIVKYTLIKGDEEKAYWEKIKKLTANALSRNKHHHKKKRFGGFVGNRFNKKNKRPADSDRDNTKKART